MDMGEAVKAEDVWEQAGGQSWFFKAQKHFRE